MGIFRVTNLVKVLLLLTLVTGCHSKPDTQDGISPLSLSLPQYSDFQLALLAQGSLLMVTVDGHIWPAYKNSDDILESYPPQLQVARYHDNTPLAVLITEIQSPQAIDSASYSADVFINGKWQAAHDFRLRQLQFEYREQVQAPWRSIELAHIRFTPH
ncbi:hypothetical protein [Alteromonas sp. C1M14]|uniref:hypothetical protein n=1 Tax=Alteromonas sp. C1M14 TaxID=2841567 RepID=UPI001C09190C|nr:hypothetical protein [Alteromonas sp. C1M14]MBU2978218.1 hypothetical protein [Alteromonas sp. C1M14]